MADRAFSGVGVTPLAGVGRARWYDPGAALDLPEPPAPSTVDPATEREAFDRARETAREELEAERERARERAGESEAEILDAHVQFVADPELIEAVEARIDGGLPAEHAVERALGEYVAQFEGMEGRMAERADDLRDVRDRLIRLLTDAERVDLAALPAGTVLLAERLTPSDTARLDPERVAGVATVAGGRTSHAAIFARALGLPAVVGVGDDLRDVPDDAEVLVDGDRGAVLVDPDDAERERASGERDVTIRTDPVTTADGRRVEVAANVGTLPELDAAVEQGADGVGLFRTEFLFLGRDAPPGEDEQCEAYVEALEAFPEGRVVFRTLDAGADKPIPYLDAPAEENPALGARGIRRSLGPDADLFETQLRALCRAGAETPGSLAVMFPMVATAAELDAALAKLESTVETLADEGVPAAEPAEVGVMIETPAAAFLAGELAQRVDFCSLGTNDLTQYVMAADRGNAAVADLHDPLHPAVLRAIARTVDAAGEDARVAMCGEMAGDPDLTGLLVGLGVEELSMSALSVPAVKATVADLDANEAASLAEAALAVETRVEVRDLLDIDR